MHHSNATSRSPSPTVSPALQCTDFTLNVKNGTVDHHRNQHWWSPKSASGWGRSEPAAQVSTTPLQESVLSLQKGASLPPLSSVSPGMIISENFGCSLPAGPFYWILRSRPRLLFAALGTEPRASWILGKSLTIKLQPQNF